MEEDINFVIHVYLYNVSVFHVKHLASENEYIVFREFFFTFPIESDNRLIWLKVEIDNHVFGNSDFASVMLKPHERKEFGSKFTEEVFRFAS